MTDTLIQRLSDEADLCRNDGATDVAKLLDDAVYALVNQAARLAAAEIVSAQPAAPAVCSSCDGTGKISGLPCAWCMQSAAPSVAPEPVAWTLQSELDAAQTTCSAHLWFTNPRNSAWTALFTREKSAAHPPRAPLTEEQKRDLVKECDLDWQRGFMLLFDDDPTNRYAVLIEAVEAAHGIGGK